MFLLKLLIFSLLCTVSLSHGISWNNHHIVNTLKDVAKTSSSACQWSLGNLTTKETIMYIDASGKPGAGVLDGDLVWLGRFDECTDIDGSHFISMMNIVVSYQNRSMPLKKYGLCIPKECSIPDSISFLKGLLKEFLPFVKQKLDLDISIRNVTNGVFGKNVHVYEKDRPYSSGTITMLVISGIIAALCLIGTAVDIFLEAIKVDVIKDEANIVNDNESDEDLFIRAEALGQDDGKTFSYRQADISMHHVQVNTAHNKLLEFFMCFSIVKNSRTLFDTTVPVGAITCLNGIRTISIIWVIMGHYLIFLFEGNIANPKTVLSWLNRFTMQPLLNGGMAVDTFFVLSGVLVAYLSMRRFDKHGRLPLLRYYVHRYIRLTPSYAYVMFFFTYLYPVLSDGPNWSDGTQEGYCKDYWWTNFLYINNFWPDTIMKVCISWSWYLANDMQFYVISPLILWCMYKYRWIGVGVVGILIAILNFLTNGILIYEKNATPLFYDPSAMAFGPDSPVLNYQNYVYTKPYCRIPVYFIGLVLGYTIYRKCDFKPPQSTFYKMVGWAIAVTMVLTVVYAPYSATKSAWTDGDRVVYGMFFRVAWGISIAWIIFACHNNSGGLINDFLSWKAFIPLSRLTYAVYLIHIVVIYTLLNSQRTAIYLTEINFSVYYVATVVFSFICAYVISVGIEYPVFNLEKLFLRF